MTPLTHAIAAALILVALALAAVALVTMLRKRPTAALWFAGALVPAASAVALGGYPWVAGLFGACGAYLMWVYQRGPK